MVLGTMGRLALNILLLIKPRIILLRAGEAPAGPLHDANI